MQVINDLTLHRICKLKEKDKCIKELEGGNNSHAKWWIENKLLFKISKIKIMLITTNQMSTRYKPKDEKFINMLQWHLTGKFKQMKTS